MKVYTHEDVLKLMNRIHVYEINRDLCMLKLTPIDMEEKLLEYWNGGIKSTEEGGKSFDQYYTSTYGSKGSGDTLKDYHIVDTNEMVQLPQQEISDEEIEKGAKEWYNKEGAYSASAIALKTWVYAIRWYREQLKQKLK